MSVICNHDCFNCPYPDCMNDEITLAEYREINERDREIIWSNTLMTDVKRRKTLYERARNRKRDRQDYYKAWYKANKEAHLVSCKAWKEANKEQARMYGRARRKAQKQAKAANQTDSTTPRQVQHGI